MKKTGVEKARRENSRGIGKRLRVGKGSLIGRKLAVGEEEMVHLSLSDQFVSPS